MLTGGFFIGLHQPSDAKHFTGHRVCVSVNRLRSRMSDFTVGKWLMDSGAFTEISTHGRYRHDPSDYADQIRRWSNCGSLLAAVSQDWMCEPFIVEKTGLSVDEHQRRTVERYAALLSERLPVPVMPVLQGFEPEEYARHARLYGDLIPPRAWVGVGSVCKRNASPLAITRVLLAIREERPDLRLHGFGIKKTSLADGRVRSLLWSADSMAWSWAARRQGRNANDWREAWAFNHSIERQAVQLPLWI